MVTSLLSSPPTSISITHKLNHWVFTPNITYHPKLIKYNSSSSFPQNKTLFCSTIVNAISTQLASNASRSTHQRHWTVVMDTPPTMLNSRPEIIDYYVQTILTVLGRWVSSPLVLEFKFFFFYLYLLTITICNPMNNS